MKKKVIFAVVFALSGWFFSVSAQDMIILKDGAIIDAKVMEIYPAEIRYKRADNLDGPMFIIPASSVLSIRYKNGTTDIINAAPSPAYAPAVPVPAPAQAASAARPPAPAPALSTARAPANAPAPAPTPAPTPATARATPPPASPPGPSADQRMAEQIASAAAGQIADQLGGAGGSQNFIQEPLLMILNSFPALPIAGNNLKFVFESERWTATVNSENYLAGNIEAEETDNGYLLKLSQTHIWPGAVGKSAGRIARLIPGGGAASSVLNTASSFAGSVVGAVEMSGPQLVLEYIAGPPAKLSFVRTESAEDKPEKAVANTKKESGAVPGASISAAPRAPKTKEPKAQEGGAESKGAFGFSFGSSFSAPWFITTVYGSVATFHNLNLDFGIDLGFVSGYENDNISYFSLYPYVNYTLNVPMGGSSLWYIGIGAGYMFASYEYQEWHEDTVDYNIFAANFCTGFIFGDWFTLSYTLRTNFTTANNKISIGYIKRFY